MKVSEFTTTEYFSFYKQYIDLVNDKPLLEALESGQIYIHHYTLHIGDQARVPEGYKYNTAI